MLIYSSLRRVLRLTVIRIDGLVGDTEPSVHVRSVREEGDGDLVALHLLHVPQLLPAQPGVEGHRPLTQ